MIWFLIAVGLIARSANRKQEKRILHYLMRCHEVESDLANASTLTAIYPTTTKQNEGMNPSARAKTNSN